MAELILTKKEIEAKSWLDLDDESLGKFVKANIYKVFKYSKEELAIFPLACATALCAIAVESNVDKLELTIDNLRNKVNNFGNWKVTIKRITKSPSTSTTLNEKHDKG